MPPRKKTGTKKPTTPRSRVRASKLESFAPSPSELEIVRPVHDVRVIRLEAASVFLGIASVLVASLGYWYVFGMQGSQETQSLPIVDDSATIEYATPSQSEHYKIESAGESVVVAPAPASIKVAVFSTVSIPKAAARLKTQLEAAGFVVAAIGNERPTQKITTIRVKKSAERLGEPLFAVVAKNYAVDLIGTLEDNSPYDAVILIGSQTATP